MAIGTDRFVRHVDHCLQLGRQPIDRTVWAGMSAAEQQDVNNLLAHELHVLNQQRELAGNIAGDYGDAW